jgi:2-polyprenyl-3-methyl-5-hydroxy-6-metoxy-1,4-benzoquinol methylase
VIFLKKALPQQKEEAKNMGLTNVRFEIKDALLIEELGKYDLITAFDTIHDQAQPTKVLKAINESLKKDGFFLMQDIEASSMVDKNINSPLTPALYTISTMHCMSVSLAYNGEGLGTMWGKELAVKKLNEAGFKDIKVKNVEGDIINYYYLSRKS